MTKRRRTGLTNAGADARRLYGKRYGGISVKNVSTSVRDEFEGKVTGEYDETLLFVLGRTPDETTAMMCGALRAAKVKTFKWMRSIRVPCSTCKAIPSMPCTTTSGAMAAAPHRDRLDRLQEARRKQQ